MFEVLLLRYLMRGDAVPTNDKRLLRWTKAQQLPRW